MKKSSFALHGFLYVPAAHLSGYLTAVLAFVLLPADWIHLTYLFALGGCVLSLPLFVWWFHSNENPIGYLAATALSQLVCGLAGVGLIFPMIALAKALTADSAKLNPWAFFAVWVGVALFFGAVLLALCLGLLIYTLIRRRTAAPPSERKAPHEEI
jgi:hypothetical protein